MNLLVKHGNVLRNEQDSLNAAAGGNLLSKTTREALNIIENKSKVRYSRNKTNASRVNSRENVSKTDERIDKLADQLSTLVEIVSKKVVVPPAPVKAVEENCVTCGGAHAWYNCPATDNNQNVCATTGSYNQQAPPNRVSNQMAPPGFAPVQNQGQNRNYNNQGQGNNFNRGNNFQNQGCKGQSLMINRLGNLAIPNHSMKSGELKNEIQNTIKNQQTVLMSQNNDFQNTLQNNLQNMLSSFFQDQASPSGTLPSNMIPNPKGEMKAITTRSGVAYEGPSNPTKPSPKEVVERETEEITDEEQNDFHGSTAKIPPPVIPKPIPEPEIPKTLPKSTLIPEPEIPKTVPKANIPYPSRRDNQKNREKASYQKEKIFQMFQDLRFDICFADALKDIYVLEQLLNDDPFQLPPMDLKQSEVTEAKSSIKEPSELELKDLPSHLEYAFLEENEKLPIIIAKDDCKPSMQSQRRVNPKTHEVIKKEVIKLLDARMICPISDSPWVSLIHCVPKKGRMTVVANEENELIPTRLVTGWSLCIDYRKLNKETRKDHFPLPFMDQMLERLAGNEFYCFLDGFSGSKSGGWDQFGSNISTALICLSTGRDFNFSKLIFDGMISNLKSKYGVQLVREVLSESPHPLLDVDEEDLDLGEQNIKHCKRNICDGHYNVAVRVLSSSGVALYN
ncbi:hypothetical protein Tco_1301281, partial [Tanacetum coccineum]